MVFCEEVQSVATNSSIIPAHCLSFYEQSLFLAEFAEAETNSLFESLGIEELAVFESTGELVVYEGARFDEFKKSAIATFQKIWGAIKGFFEKITKWFNEQKAKTVEAVNKFKAELAEKAKENRVKFTDKVTDDLIDTLDKDKVYMKINDYAGLKGMIEEFVKGQSEITNKIDSELSKIQIGAEDKREQIREKEENIMKDIIAKISGVKDAGTVQDAIKKIKEDCFGGEVEVKAAWIKANKKDISDVIQEGFYLGALKVAYNKSKAEIDKIIKDLKSAKEGEAEVISSKIRLYKKSISCYHSCVSAVMDVYRRRYSQYRSVFLTVIFRGNTKKTSEEKTDVKESAVTTQEDLVNEAFNWN